MSDARRARSRRIDREIATIAVPAALALATDPLYDLCDTAILGHVGTAQLAGAALATRLLAFGYAVFVFLMFGTTAAVARSLGAGRRRQASDEAVAATWIAIGLGIAAAAVFALTGRTLIGWMGGTGEVARHAWTYLWVSLAGLPAFTTVMVGVGFRRGHHDTRTPLVVAAMTVTLNLVLELVAVFGLGYGVGASALGTVVAKWVGAAIYIVLIGRTVRSDGSSWRLRRVAVRGQLVVGRDLVVRTVVLLGVLTAAQSFVARLGTRDLAAHAIAFQLWLFAAYATDGLEAAGQTMVAHRLGAGDLTEVSFVTRRLLRWAALLGAGFAVVIAATSGLSPHLFTADAAVATTATGILVWVACLQPVNAVAFALDGIGVGASRQRFLAVAMATAGVGFVAVVSVTGDSLHGVWAALSAFMVLRCAVGLWGLRDLSCSSGTSSPTRRSVPARTPRR